MRFLTNRNLAICGIITLLALLISTYETKVVVEINPLKSAPAALDPNNSDEMTREFFQTQFRYIKSEETLENATEIQSYATEGETPEPLENAAEE